MIAPRPASGCAPKTSGHRATISSYVFGVRFAHRVGSRSFAFAVTADGLVATIAWGSFDEAQARALSAAWLASLAGPPRETLIDITHLVMSDDAAFTVFRAALEAHREERARAVRRQALVMRGGYAASFVCGYLAQFPPPYEVRHFAERDDALAWLGHADCRDALAELEVARHDLLARLRAWLERTNLGTVTIEAAAAELGVTSRTLQRRLAELESRFATEVARVQVARAQQLMQTSDRKLSDVALEVGCATPSGFSDLFRRITGETPSQWRRARKLS